MSQRSPQTPYLRSRQRTRTSAMRPMPETQAAKVRTGVHTGAGSAGQVGTSVHPCTLYEVFLRCTKTDPASRPCSMRHDSSNRLDGNSPAPKESGRQVNTGGIQATIPGGLNAPSGRARTVPISPESKTEKASSRASRRLLERSPRTVHHKGGENCEHDEGLDPPSIRSHRLAK